MGNNFYGFLFVSSDYEASPFKEANQKGNIFYDFLFALSDYKTIPKEGLLVKERFNRENVFYDFLFAPPDDKTILKRGLLLKRKNLLLGEQILSFKGRPLLKREAKMK